jgi:hypothetical protein
MNGTNIIASPIVVDITVMSPKRMNRSSFKLVYHDTRTHLNGALAPTISNTKTAFSKIAAENF